ncbi:MAG TPA: hypothetical protein VKI99_02955 [Candidatus Dormibacteraeota bacterium]|nr:hypothetical protein [Candidatus Dormibacteraeota bacterium]
MGIDDRERRQRLRFGPPAGPPLTTPPRVRRLPTGLLVASAFMGAAAATAAAFLLATPHGHVAPGCWWWTATRAGDVVPGGLGCLRGYYRGGGSIAEGPRPADYALAIAYGEPDQPKGRAPCPFRSGDAVVVRYHAVFDDGRTIAVIDDCR